MHKSDLVAMNQILQEPLRVLTHDPTVELSGEWQSSIDPDDVGVDEK